MACQREVKVTVEQRPESTVFKATRGDAPACIDEVRVYEATDQLNPVWTLVLADDGTCRDQFAYGASTPGFVASGPAPMLKHDVQYVVTMDGAGLVGQGKFQGD